MRGSYLGDHDGVNREPSVSVLNAGVRIDPPAAAGAETWEPCLQQRLDGLRRISGDWIAQDRERRSCYIFTEIDSRESPESVDDGI